MIIVLIMKMRIPNSTITFCVKALSQSMDNRTMSTLTRRLIPGYDLHQRTGIPSSVAIPNQNAARQVVKDIIACNLFLDFVLLLINFSDQGKGIAGRKIAIPYLRQILNSVYQLGYIYDPSSRMFLENPAVRKTRNWGTLKNNVEYTIAFLRIDIAGNTKLVRKHGADQIRESYRTLRGIVTRAVDKRNGRVWGWDGDGGLAAFCFGNMNETAVLAALEVIHELFLYNHTDCPVDDGIHVRIAVHSGPFEYTSGSEEIQQAETVKKVNSIEKNQAETDSVTTSQAVNVMLEPLTARQFDSFKAKDNRVYYRYKLELAD